MKFYERIPFSVVLCLIVALMLTTLRVVSNLIYAGEEMSVSKEYDDLREESRLYVQGVYGLSDEEYDRLNEGSLK